MNFRLTTKTEPVKYTSSELSSSVFSCNIKRLVRTRQQKKRFHKSPFVGVRSVQFLADFVFEILFVTGVLWSFMKRGGNVTILKLKVIILAESSTVPARLSAVIFSSWGPTQFLTRVLFLLKLIFTIVS